MDHTDTWVRPQETWAMFEQRDAVTAPELRSRGSLKWTAFGSDVIAAFVAEMDFDTAPAVRQSLAEAVRAGRFGYLPATLAADLARACAGWQQQRYGWAVPPEQVQPVTDVLTALKLVLRHLIRPGSPIILPTPAYMPFLTIPPLAGHEVLQVPMRRDETGRYALDLPGLDAAFRRGGELLILCNPANPVGRVFTAPELAAVTELVDAHRGRVFADEVHAPLIFPGQRHLPYAATSPVAAAHTITATSASKAWNLPGLKCAQVILAPAELARWQQVGAYEWPSTLGAVANIAAYEQGESWLDELLTYLDRNRAALAELLTERLPAVGYRPPEGTYLAWLDLRQLATGSTDGRLDTLLRERAAVAVVDGADCGDAGRGHVRLNFATPLPILDQLIARIAGTCAPDRKAVR